MVENMVVLVLQFGREVMTKKVGLMKLQVVLPHLLEDRNLQFFK